MLKKCMCLLALVLGFSACHNSTEEQKEVMKEDIYSSIFQDNYFRQLSYLTQEGQELLTLLNANTGSEESYLVFWMKDGDCDSCIEQQVQFLKLVLAKATKPVIVLADYNSKRVFSSVQQSSFSFVDMKLLQMPEELYETVGSPFYIHFQKADSTLSIFKPIPERASWTQRYLESIGAL